MESDERRRGTEREWVRGGVAEKVGEEEGEEEERAEGSRRAAEKPEKDSRLSRHATEVKHQVGICAILQRCAGRI